MRKLTILTGLVLTSLTWGQSTSFQALADKYSGIEGYTYIYITEYMFQLAGAISDNEDPEVKEMLKNLKSLIVISASDELSANEKKRFSDEVSAAMPQKDYKILMKVKDGDENVEMLAKETSGIINELIISVKSSNEDLVLVLTGNIDLKAISKLSKTMDIEGLEQLEKVNETTID